MLYQPGDYVYPADLPRRLLCRVQQAETLKLRGGVAQMLRLEPLEGPWPTGTKLIRLDEYVMPVQPRQLWRGTSGTRPPGGKKGHGKDHHENAT